MTQCVGLDSELRGSLDSELGVLWKRYDRREFMHDHFGQSGGLQGVAAILGHTPPVFAPGGPIGKFSHDALDIFSDSLRRDF